MVNESKIKTYTKRVNSARSTMDEVSRPRFHGQHCICHCTNDGIYVGIPARPTGVGECNVTVDVLTAVNHPLLRGHAVPYLLKISFSSLHLHNSSRQLAANLQLQ